MKHPCARGFTLVEVLVAMVIMAILAVMAWQGVDGIVRARDASQSRLEQTLRLNTVLAQWEQDLASMQDSRGAVPPLGFDGATVRLTRRTERGMQVVTWTLQPSPEGTAGGGSLLRWAGPPVTTRGELQDMWFRTQQFQGLEVGQLRTLKGLSQWQVYCYWNDAWSNCQSTGGGLLKGVRLVLQFAGGDLHGSLTRDVLVAP
jgi:general secretion pathway protein J